jgi:hypothetical protein
MTLKKQRTSGNDNTTLTPPHQPMTFRQRRRSHQRMNQSGEPTPMMGTPPTQRTTTRIKTTVTPPMMGATTMGATMKQINSPMRPLIS